MNDDPQSAGGTEDLAVVRYLAALETRRTAPDTLPQPDDAAASLARFEPPPEDAEDLEVQLGRATPGSRHEIEALEDGFVEAAADYGRRHDITYDGWRNAGVSAEVLERAGIRPDPPEPRIHS